MKSIENPKVISLFCGCGGFDLAFHRAGFKTVWANDNNKWAIKTFNDNFEDIAHLSSIEDYDPYYDSTIPDADLILGGFPCQDFSIIGKRNGINSSRGNLYRHFIKFIDAKKPFVFVAENVKGILSANNGQAIKQIVKDFESINPGYTVKIQLYNFSEYGVPQFRERVIFVGIRTDAGFNFMHPSPTCGPRTNKPYTTAGEALKDVEKIQHNNELIRHNHKTVEMLKLIPEGGNFADIDKTHPLYVKGMVSNIYRRINRNEPSKTVIASGGGGTWGYHYPEPRALTNRERARLQTFPDNFIFAGPLSEVRRQIGNAVPPLGIGPIANELFKLFQGDFFSF
jgi:DNA (cytosine-5)-methyltransferase 1